ncbi:uncharacterized protein LOC134770829 [Penaeus indicus]|uniref:uncharacterized protein LOC134770829 n=1 Tax=Penaeus indicus TaxID=29960 RepID=UPI00300CF401
MPGRSTTDAIFALRMVTEKYREGQKQLSCVFIDLEKADDRVPREELWHCMRDMHIHMYKECMTTVRCAVSTTEGFKVEVGLHQGLALRPFLFAIIMDTLSTVLLFLGPPSMLFADDILLCTEDNEEAEQELERWRHALERRGVKVSRSKTKYMFVNERDGDGRVSMENIEIKKVQEFKYLGSTMARDGDIHTEVSKRLQSGWKG